MGWKAASTSHRPPCPPLGYGAIRPVLGSHLNPSGQSPLPAQAGWLASTMARWGLCGTPVHPRRPLRRLGVRARPPHRRPPPRPPSAAVPSGRPQRQRGSLRPGVGSEARGRDLEGGKLRQTTRKLVCPVAVLLHVDNFSGDVPTFPVRDYRDTLPARPLRVH